MKKQIISLALTAAMLLPGGAAAASPEQAESAEASALAFSQIETLVRENNTNVAACLESLAQLDSFDRKLARKALVDAYNGISRMDMTGSMASTLSTLEDQIDDLAEDEYAKTYEDSARQIEGTVNAIVAGTEKLFIQTAELENSLAQAEIGRQQLERTIASAEAANALGASSDETLRALYEKRSTLESQIKALDAGIKTCKQNLEYMIGREPAGTIELALTGRVEEDAIAAIDLAADAESGVEKSLTVYQKRRAAKTAMDDYYDTHGGRYLKEMARHNWESAKQTAADAEESYRLSIRTAYDNLLEADRLRGVAADTFAYQQKSYAIAERQYGLGMIGRQALLAAQDSRDTARLELVQAEIDCAAAYRTYQWAANGVVG